MISELYRSNFEAQTPVIYDNAPLGKRFGDVVTDVSTSSSYQAGDTPFAVFVGYVMNVSALYPALMSFAI